MAVVKIDLAAEFTGKKAFKQADSATAQLTKSVKRLGSAFGVAFGVQGAKMAVQAFAADDKAAKVLSQTLNNLGLAFADPAVKTFIADLEKQYGVVDDFLRPAYQKLVTTTGDYKKAQDLLKTSLDLAAMSGSDVVSVSSDIAKAYAGNTKGLMKYGLGLSKTEIQAMSFEELLKRITEISGGQATIAADSYAGALGRLQVAGANASETLGKDLINALTTLGGDGGLPKTLGLIESISAAVGDAIIGFARLIKIFDIVGNSSSPLDAFKKVSAYQKTYRAADAKERRQYGGIYAQNYLATAQKNAPPAIDPAYVKAQKALLKAQQDQLKLAKAKAVFDLQKIQIEAALKGKISEEDAIRLKLMKAIVDENMSDIEKYQKALEDAQKKTKELNELLVAVKSLEIKDPFAEWKVDPLTKAINDLTTSIGGVGTAITGTGKEWSSFANSIATTVIRPNLTEWSSSFSSASAQAAAATAAANAGLTATTAAAIKAATDAAAASAAAIASANKSTADAIAAAGAAASSAVEKLNKDTATSIEAAKKAAQDAIDNANKTAAETTASILANASAAAAAAAAASAIGTVDTTTLAGILAASGNGSGSSTNTKIEVTVTGDPFTDPNVVAEKIVEILNNAGARGTIDIQGID